MKPEPIPGARPGASPTPHQQPRFAEGDDPRAFFERLVIARRESGAAPSPSDGRASHLAESTASAAREGAEPTVRPDDGNLVPGAEEGAVTDLAVPSEVSGTPGSVPGLGTDTTAASGAGSLSHGRRGTDSRDRRVDGADSLEDRAAAPTQHPDAVAHAAPLAGARIPIAVVQEIVEFAGFLEKDEVQEFLLRLGPEAGGGMKLRLRSLGARRFELALRTGDGNEEALGAELLQRLRSHGFDVALVQD
jgi:hypothetical protein